MSSEISPGPILVALDVRTDHARTHLFDLAEAQARMTGARLVFLTVVPELYLSTATDPESVISGMTAHAERRLEATIAGRWPGADLPERQVRYGSVAGAIIRVAEEIGSGLIMIHAARPGMARHALGSVASRVVNHAGASVYVVRE